MTALAVIPGFLWVGTSCGLILVYPLPKLQGVPRVINHACVAFHAHSGPVRSLFAVPEGITSLDEANVDDDLVSDVIGVFWHKNLFLHVLLKRKHFADTSEGYVCVQPVAF